MTKKQEEAIKQEALNFDDDDFTKAIIINPDTLADDIMKQPSIYWKFGKVVAFAQKVASDCESRVQLLEKQAKIVLAEEQQKAIEEGEKVTVKAAENAGLSSKRYKLALQVVEDARAALAEATYEANLMQFAERCMRQRADLLKSLAFLEIGGNRIEGGAEIRERYRVQNEVENLEEEAQRVFSEIKERGER